jgi:hypothetical protein
MLSNRQDMFCKVSGDFLLMLHFAAKSNTRVAKISIFAIEGCTSNKVSTHTKQAGAV